MEELFPFLILILFVIPTVFSISSEKKKQEQKKQQEAQRRPQSRKPQPAPAKPAKEASVLPPREERRIRPSLTPSLHDHSGLYDGSLLADNGTEGSDPHDHGFDHEVDMPSEHSADALNESLLAGETPAAAAPALKLDFSPKNIASAFVLQEVLKRR